MGNSGIDVIIVEGIGKFFVFEYEALLLCINFRNIEHISPLEFCLFLLEDKRRGKRIIQEVCQRISDMQEDLLVCKILMLILFV